VKWEVMEEEQIGRVGSEFSHNLRTFPPTDAWRSLTHVSPRSSGEDPSPERWGLCYPAAGRRVGLTFMAASTRYSCCWPMLAMLPTRGSPPPCPGAAPGAT
jgi:hypothetical protein